MRQKSMFVTALPPLEKGATGWFANTANFLTFSKHLLSTHQKILPPFLKGEQGTMAK